MSTTSEPPHDPWEPLYLSTIAGLSTCFGAAVVFCQPKNDQSNTKVVPPKTMAFSLALAGSVMITVSVISILPEVLMDDSSSGDEEIDDGYKMIEIFSWEMFCRIIFFGLGCGLYFGLSSLLHVPEPDEMLDQVLNLEKNKNNNINENDSQLSDEKDRVDKESSSPKETEMVSLLSSAKHEHSGGNGRRTSRSPSPLRERRKQLFSARDVSPGDNNGKVKPSPPFNNDTISFGAWTTGEDLISNEQKKAWRVAILLFVSLLVHNFPEGLAVAASALESSKLGLTVTIGIMVHNIPEGIAIAIPCLAARPDQPWLSFMLASVSGLAEPMGAFVALLFLRDIKGDKVESREILNLENILSFVAGIMVMVALWELFPEAKRHATDTMKYFWYGTISGVIIMTLTELYLP